jgi:hypothetical protein
MDVLHQDTIRINDTIFDVKRNVKDVFMDVHNGNKTYSYHDLPMNEDETTNVFFLFEVPLHEAFAHWVCESAVFLPYVKHFVNDKLSDSHPFYILVNKNSERKYKKLFLKMFDIDDQNVYYIDNANINTSHIAYENIPPNNICISCRNFLLTHNTEYLANVSIETFTGLLTQFHEMIIKSYIDKMPTLDNTEIEHLFLPRSKTQNYVPNDRQYDYTNVYDLLKDKDYVEYDTIKTEDFIEQIHLLQKSKNIYLDGGSSYAVNGFFCKDSVIHVKGYNTWQIGTYKLYAAVVDMIENRNTVVRI